MLRNFVYVTFILLFISCAKQKPEIRIGLSHADLEGDWGTLMYREIVNELSLYYNYDINLIVKDAKTSNQKQNKDITELYKQGIDVLIVYPNDSLSVVPITEDLYSKKLPIILVDRKLSTNKFNVFVGNDNFKIGIEAGNYALNKLKFKGKILEIGGIRGSSSAIERSKGFREAIQKYTAVSIKASFSGDWLENTTAYRTDSILKTGFRPDLIFAHTDVMALSARKICEKYHIHPVIIGVDGLPNKNAGIDMVLNHQIDATFYNDPGGDKVAQLAMELYFKRKAPKYVTLKTFPIDSNNAASIKVGYEIQQEQFEKIRKQLLQLKIMAGTIRTQDMQIYLYIAFIILLIIVVFAVLYFLKQNQKYSSMIQVQKEKIEYQIEEEKSLTDQLIKNNMILQGQREEILEKNKNLEKYRNQLEELVRERTIDLETALEKVNESDKLKTSFLSNLSHEIRTPLNSIMGFVELLVDPNTSKQDDEKYRIIIVQSSNQLLKSITQIVEIAKLTTEKVEFVKSIISVPQLFKELEVEISDSINEMILVKSDNVELNILPTPEMFIETDVCRIKQVLTCMIDNALKFTNQGYINVGFEVVNDESVRFYVRDTGIGIEKENQDVIFEKFRKIEDDSNIIYRGTGLGLAISKRIVELLGGSISLKSELGVGSEFSFVVPSSAENQKTKINTKEQKNSIMNPEDIKILVAEDEEINFIYIETLLKKKFKKIIRAKNGLEAYNYCVDNHPDIILMDIKMPIMNGFEALKKIRAIYPDILVMAITAHAFTNEKEQILNEGFNSYIAKPFTAANLFKMIEDLIHLG